VQEWKGNGRSSSRAARELFGWISVGGADSEQALQNQARLSKHPRLIPALAAILVAGPGEGRYNACRLFGRALSSVKELSRRALREAGMLEALIYASKHTPGPPPRGGKAEKRIKVTEK
jgi:hypothetical protein